MLTKLSIPENGVTFATSRSALELLEFETELCLSSTVSDTTVPEKEAAAESLEEIRDFLESAFPATYIQTTLDRIYFRPDKTVEVEGIAMPFTPSFLEAVAHSIIMPLSYAYRLNSELFRANFERRKQLHSKAVTVCRSRGVAVNLVGTISAGSHSGCTCRPCG